MRYTSPHHIEHVFPVIWESYDAWLRCWPEKVQSYQIVLILIFNFLSVTLTFEVQASVLVKSYDAWLRSLPDKVLTDGCKDSQGTDLSNSIHFDL